MVFSTEKKFSGIFWYQKRIQDSLLNPRRDSVDFELLPAQEKPTQEPPDTNISHASAKKHGLRIRLIPHIDYSAFSPQGKSV